MVSVWVCLCGAVYHPLTAERLFLVAESLINCYVLIPLPRGRISRNENFPLILGVGKAPAPAPQQCLDSPMNVLSLDCSEECAAVQPAPCEHSCSQRRQPGNNFQALKGC